MAAKIVKKMNFKIEAILSKIDYRISPTAFSRAKFQVTIIIQRLLKLNKNLFSILDIGGGFEANYKENLLKISHKYANLEIKKGKRVDIVGSVYKIPKPNLNYDLITMFMVLEHLSDPLAALKECHRILNKKGIIAITTVQYWHTHSYPSDYYRYTKFGLQYLLKQSGFKIIKIWSHGGPFLVLFHVIELNLPNSLRAIYSICFYKLMDWLDWLFFKHEDKRKPNNDSVGWSVIAQKI